MLDLAGNPEDRFSHNEAQLMLILDVQTDLALLTNNKDTFSHKEADIHMYYQSSSHK